MSIESMKNRLKYYGGGNQVDRMNRDKLKSLKDALTKSYQAAIARFSDGREFRCLINPDKLTFNEDIKIISIPFKGMCLNPEILFPGLDMVDEGDWENMEDLVATLEYEGVEATMELMEDIFTPDQFFPANGATEENLVIDPNVPGYNAEEEIETGLKEGDVICWTQNGSYWLVYSRYLEETAYFRAKMQRCRHVLTLGNSSKYWIYLKGPKGKDITWDEVSNNYFNTLNYSLSMYITKNEETLKYFSRFTKVKIGNNIWEVQSVDRLTNPGLLELTLKETFNNSIKDDIEKVVENLEKEDVTPEPEEEILEPYIHGANVVYPYDTKVYEIRNCADAGVWQIQSETRKNMVQINNMTSDKIEIMILTGRSGAFELTYKINDTQVIILPITIKSL